MPWIWKPHRSRPHVPRPRTGSPVCIGHPGSFHRPIHCQRRGNGIPAGSYLLHQRFVCPRCGSNHWRYPA